MPISLKPSVVAGVLLCLVLAACNGTTPPTSALPDPKKDGPLPPQQVVSKTGIVTVSTVVDPTSSDRTAVAVLGMFNHGDPTPVADIRDPRITQDFCYVGNPDDEPGTIPAGLLIDAGSSLTIQRADGEVLFSVPRQTGHIYLDSFVGDVLPDGATLTVPGSHFPRFENVALPPTPPMIVLTSPQGAAVKITASTNLTWEPSAMPAGITNEFVLVVIMLDPTPGSTQEFPTVLLCGGPNDGQFSVPAETVAELGNPSFEGNIFQTGLAYFRERLDPASGALLTVGVVSTNSPASVP